MSKSASPHPRMVHLAHTLGATKGDPRPVLAEAEGMALAHKWYGPGDDTPGEVIRVLPGVLVEGRDGWEQMADVLLLRIPGEYVGDAWCRYEVAVIGERIDDCDGPEAGGPADPADDLAYATELARHPFMRWDGVWPDWDRAVMNWNPSPEEVREGVVADGRWKAQRAALRRVGGRLLPKGYPRCSGNRIEQARRRGRAVAEVAADCAGGGK
jgi:hypothetical protein